MRFGLFALLVPALALGQVSTPTPERQQALLDLLHQDCGSCHGMTLQGGLGPALLSSALAGKSEAMLAGTILNGRPGTAMPPWSRFLSREEADWLVTQLKYNPPRFNDATRP